LLRIRLSRVGKKKQPAYRIVVADSRSPRDGAFLKIIGHYNPLTDPATLVVKEEEAVHWLQKGAQPSETAAKLLTRMGVMERAGKAPFHYQGKDVPAGPRPKKGVETPPAPAPVKAVAAAPEPVAAVDAPEADAAPAPEVEVVEAQAVEPAAEPEAEPVPEQEATPEPEASGEEEPKEETESTE
jgi:small subunit ribosomal protein S16